MLRFVKLESQLSQVQIGVNNLSAAMLASTHLPGVVSPYPANQRSAAKGQADLRQEGKAGGPIISARSTSINGQCLQPRRVWADEPTTGSSCDGDEC